MEITGRFGPGRGAGSGCESVCFHPFGVPDALCQRCCSGSAFHSRVEWCQQDGYGVDLRVVKRFHSTFPSVHFSRLLVSVHKTRQRAPLAVSYSQLLHTLHFPPAEHPPRKICSFCMPCKCPCSGVQCCEERLATPQGDGHQQLPTALQFVLRRDLMRPEPLMF
jgi:hypothetical protein